MNGQPMPVAAAIGSVDSAAVGVVPLPARLSRKSYRQSNPQRSWRFHRRGHFGIHHYEYGLLGKWTINVYVDGALQRTAVLAFVFDSNQNHARMIFQPLTLPDGTNVPVVITLEANRLATRD